MYDKKYVLALPFAADDIHSILNGRIFKLKRIKDGNYMEIYEAFTEELLFTSTHIVNRVDSDGGFVTITTGSGTVYNLRRLSALIPTTIIPEQPEKVVFDPATLVVVLETSDRQDIDYCDGWFERKFEFDREISEEEFRAFCKMKGLALKPKGAWYEDWNTVQGAGKVWSWRVNHPYKD